MFDSESEVRNIKLKEWIRNKLVNFVKLDDIYEHTLSEINRLDKDIKQQDKRSDSISISIQQTNNAVRNNREDIDILHNTIKSVVSIGADVIPNRGNERSWAVICIEGNYNVVKFVDFHGADYRYIMDFLKQFEGSRMVIDAPNPRMFESSFKF